MFLIEIINHTIFAACYNRNMIVAGYLASVLIGISLGLIGGGGSILTVPVMVYLFGIEATRATVYSLFVVGLTSATGSVSYFRKGLADMRTALVFGLPSVAAVYTTRTWVVPAIPAHIATIGSFAITKDMLLMLLFAVLMIFASASMIRKGKGETETTEQGGYNYPVLIGQGLFVGTLTGLIGAGGGFLIIPALVNLLKMPMKKAVGTSLVIIAINSGTGFLFSLSRTVINWPLLLSVAAIAIGGILAGSMLAARIDGKRLKPAFGWFVLIMGVYILIKETLLK